MRRIIFYLLVALLAFGIGSFIVISLYQQQQTISIKREIASVKTISEVENVPVVNKVEDTNEQKICSGLSSDDLFEPAIKNWLKGKLIEGKPMRPPKEYRSEGDEFVPSLVDINLDGRKELLIKSHCSPMSNCYFTLYKRTRNGYESILINPLRKIQNVSFGKSAQKDYLDIKAKTQQTENSGFHSTYKYDGEMYQAIECFKYSISRQFTENLESINCNLVEDELKQTK